MTPVRIEELKDKLQNYAEQVEVVKTDVDLAKSRAKSIKKAMLFAVSHYSHQA